LGVLELLRWDTFGSRKVSWCWLLDVSTLHLISSLGRRQTSSEIDCSVEPKINCDQFPRPAQLTDSAICQVCNVQFLDLISLRLIHHFLN
jgi:hypothetical protein